MRIKLDENMPATLARELATLGHDVDTVPAEQLASRPDADIWAAAQRTRRLLITQDLDFSDIRQFEPGVHFGLLLVRLAQPGRRALARRVRIMFENEDVETWRRCFVVATDRKIRVRRPSRSKAPRS